MQYGVASSPDMVSQLWWPDADGAVSCQPDPKVLAVVAPCYLVCTMGRLLQLVILSETSSRVRLLIQLQPEVQGLAAHVSARGPIVSTSTWYSYSR